MLNPISTSIYDALYEHIKSRYETDQLEEIRRAYQVAEEAHDGQMRQSGEPYITHPVAVAIIVSEMGMDYRSVIAALLHDVLEDTPVTKDELAQHFGQEVASLVDGLSKLTHLKFKSKQEAQAQNFRKMLLAMVDDIRVIIVKLADRTHNMRTLGCVSAEKRRRVAKETLSVYAPIAYRLGITRAKNELEDLGFKALYPARYRVLNEAVKKARGNRKELIQKIEIQAHAHLEEAGIQAEVTGREKHLYSLYGKMKKKQLSFQEVFDMFAIRIVVENTDNCYRALGVMHNRFRPKPSHFKDYIAIPKANNYQSLHTVLFSPHGVPIEVQIRTKEMDMFAESGVASHWAYKTGDTNNAQRKAREWLTNLLDMQQITSSTVEFYENVKIDLFPGEIYVFSPRGDIYRLPQDATPVDFAYAVHSDLGNACVTAKIDRRLAALSTPLVSGQTVEIITAESGHPSPMWLNFVVTAKARTAIRHYLKNLDKEKAIQFGRRLVIRALSRYEIGLDDIPRERIEQLAHELHLGSLEELMLDVGLGNHLPSLIAARLLPDKATHNTDNADNSSDSSELSPLLIEGSEGTVVSMARCCMPIPGDNVQGFVTAGKGVVVHRAGCKNVRRYRHRPKEWVPVEWSKEYDGEFHTNILIEIQNQPGTLARVTTVMSNQGANIENISFKNSGEHYTIIVFTLAASDRKHLASIIRHLRLLPVVQRVRREMN